MVIQNWRNDAKFDRSFRLYHQYFRIDISIFIVTSTFNFILQQPFWPTLFYLLVNKFDRLGPKKVPVPKKDEKPIMGLVSDKNFIVSNAVENILAAPKLPTNNEKDFLKKKNYGKVPKYLQTIKKEIEDEYQLVREM